LNSINHLIECLIEAKINKLILISTIAVYPNPINVDEDSQIDNAKLNYYGQNRLNLELQLKKRFKTTILRLPALFGNGLKKNVLYDLIHKKHLDSINLESTYQFYNLDNLTKDIDNAIKHNLNLLNLATEPIKLAEILKSCFDYKIKGNLKASLRKENMLSKYSKILNKENNYLYMKNEILDDLKEFIISQK
tara:strand:- start:4395 stop:4970 length:576 start_codon:yes stop_codon:yes gene_type:complete